MINYSTPSTAITFDISSLATSTTFLAGRESNEQTNATTRYDDVELYIKGITGHATTAPVVGQMIQIYAWGSEVSLATTPIDVLDGVDSVETLSHDAVRQSLAIIASPTVTVATAALVYPTRPITLAQFFGGSMPLFWGLFLAHNHAGALAAAQSALFSFRGINYTAA